MPSARTGPDVRTILTRRLGAEFLGTAFLLATVVGSGIMADRLSGGNDGVALLANAIATGAMLFVLIVVFAPFSGAHFNPAVTLAVRLRGEMSSRDGLSFLAVQVGGALVGVLVAHMMFAESTLQLGRMARTGAGQWLGEAVATFGLVFVILMVRKRRLETVAASVGLYITAAYWFTASTSFANPAVTIARSLTGTFAGIRPEDAPVFILMQMAGSALAVLVHRQVFERGA